MSSRIHALAAASRLLSPGRAAVLAVAALALVLAGCGENKKDKPATQTAAKVNKEEITVHQINFVLQQQRGLRPEQAASASQQILERLVDQELALQKAEEQKLDRDPRVLQQLEAARREIIARAYVEKIGNGAPKPSPAEIKAYYDEHPALFKERKLYSLQELNVETKPDQVAGLKAKLEAAKSIPDFIEYLKANDFKFGANQAVRAAEQLPLASLTNFAAMKDGQTIFTPTPTGVQIVILAGTRSQAVDETRAAPAIEQFLLNERKRKIVADDMKALHAASKIEYLGDYAKGGSKAVVPAAAAASEAPPLTSIAPPEPAGSMPSAAPQVEIELPVAASAAMPNKGTLEKGIQGFK
ncbi:MAG: EpsD family peptidyl-prolyl cis-trans isomerase [Burkholderiaceae bacterium]